MPSSILELLFLYILLYLQLLIPTYLPTYLPTGIPLFSIFSFIAFFFILSLLPLSLPFCLLFGFFSSFLSNHLSHLSVFQSFSPLFVCQKSSNQSRCSSLTRWLPVWPDWAIYSTLGNFLKPLATINLFKSPTFLGNFVKVLKSIIFLVNSFLGNFYRHLAIFSGHTAHLLPGWLAARCINFQRTISSHLLSSSYLSSPSPILSQLAHWTGSANGECPMGEWHTRVVENRFWPPRRRRRRRLCLVIVQTKIIFLQMRDCQCDQIGRFLGISW